MTAAQDPELLARAIRNPGRLVVAPTTTSGAFPYGGTPVGLVTAAELEWDVRYQENRDPASGGAISEVARRSVEFPRLALMLDGPQRDEDALLAIFTQATPFSGLAVQSPRETRLEGTLLPRVVAAWLPLLFASLDPLGECAYFRRPVPLLSLRKSVEYAAKRKAGLPILFAPTPDAAWATIPYWQVGRLENLTL